MTTIDFAAAQQRVAARQERRLAQSRADASSRQASHASSAFSRLPFPLDSIGKQALQTWDQIKGREGTRPYFRVGQVDAELLDEELLELLRGQVGEGLKYFGTHIRDDYSSEIQLALRLILFKLSIWDHNASYGASLQSLRYTDARNSGLLPLPPTTAQKLLYGFFTVGGRYGWEKWEDWLLDREDRPSQPTRLLSRLSALFSTTYSVAAFVSFLFFLLNGRYRTLLDRILRMRLAPPTPYQLRRDVSFEYLNRQLVWHAFTEFLLFLLPLVGISRWRRWISRSWRKTKRFVQQSSKGEKDDEMEQKGELAFLPERTCAICYHDQNPMVSAGDEGAAVAAAVGQGGIVGGARADITNPYETVPCGCIYCYICIATKLEAEEGEGWICLRCGELVKECEPWNGDVLEVREDEEESSPRNVIQIHADETLATEESDDARGFSKGEWKQHESDSGVDLGSG
ncbi:uncharacterized protein KY384_001337 [Bacidia gigantensis]|uniref:uncharacterized protein n=1 Tax=Bacidia gigantensis TaxID=2732470 RepID=UPI001D0414D0|nr:uncharacterized protein KY384_001337 [Bacidia gigantensis]KAG8533597.1 hypothetical protein KY384_001337 [Bacidia gigantensis]